MTDDQPRRRANGDSWVSEEPNVKGYWEAFVWMGTKADGKPDRRHVERKSRASRDAQVKKLERQRDAGRPGKPGKKPTVKTMLTAHLEQTMVSRGRAENTIKSYRSLCVHQIFPRWGHIRIDRLLDEQIEEGYAAMLKAGLAPSSVVKVHAILSSAYALAVSRGKAARNPCDTVRPPELPESAREGISQRQAADLVAAIRRRRNWVRWAIALIDGPRQGEVLGLRWKYAELTGEGGQLRVWHQLQRFSWKHGCDPRCEGKRGADCPQRHGGGLRFVPIKEKRRKVIVIGALLAAALADHRMNQHEERRLAGDDWQENDLIFCNPDGSPIDSRADWQEWHDILEEAGIDHMGVHGARHTAATIALNEDIALTVVQEILGHSTIVVTRGYQHVSGPLRLDAAVRMEAAILGKTT